MFRDTLPRPIVIALVLICTCAVFLAVFLIQSEWQESCEADESQPSCTGGMLQRHAIVNGTSYRSVVVNVRVVKQECSQSRLLLDFLAIQLRSRRYLL